ncbi:MAG: sugar kinase [bacterium]
MTNKPFDVLVVGELNADLILFGMTQSPELGKEILADRMTLTMGSSSAIFAVNLASLGAKVAFAGRLGEDAFGKLVLESLQQGGVDTSSIIVDPSTPTGVTAVLGWGGDRAMVTFKGAMDDLKEVDITDGMLARARHLHVSSFYLQDELRPGCATLFKRAHDAGLTTSFDTQWDPAETWKGVHDVLKHTDIFLPNESEALAISGAHDIADAIEALHHRGMTLVVKAGGQGAKMRNAEGVEFQVEPLDVNVVDAVGAGDSFDAGFVYAGLRGFDDENALTFANAIAAYSVTAAGGTAALTDRDGTQRWLTQHGFKGDQKG